MTTSLKDTVSAIVSEQLPEFVRADYPTFVAFLEAYYEFMEQNQNALELVRTAKLNADIDTSIDEFAEQFRKQYLVQLPKNILSDKRKVVKFIRDFYTAKGSTKSYELLFRLLYNEGIELYFPKVDMLRVSDGKWAIDEILGVKNLVGDSSKLIGLQVVQADNPTDPNINLATAIVENVISFQVGATTITQLYLTKRSIVGTFLAGQTITAIVPETNATISMTVDSIINNATVVEGGNYHSVGETPILSGGGGTDAILDVTQINKGVVEKIIIDNPGTGYVAGDVIVFNNTGTNGAGAVAIVKRVNGQFIQENGTDGILMEDGSSFLVESGVGDITAIELTNGGYNYQKTPTATITSTAGTGAKLIVQSDSIGKILEVAITNFGTSYSSVPSYRFPTNLLVGKQTGNFISGETVTSEQGCLLLEDGREFLSETDDRVLKEQNDIVTGTVKSWDANRGLLILDSADIFGSPARISGVTSGVTAKVYDFKPVNLNLTVGPYAVTYGKFLNADGRISEASKKIQDSYYYQDFSYVVKVGQSINNWRDAVKRILHPVGLALFGEVSIRTTLRPNPINSWNEKLNGTMPRFRQIRLLLTYILGSVEVNMAQSVLTKMLHSLSSSNLAIRMGQPEFMPALIFPRGLDKFVNLPADIQLYRDTLIFLIGNNKQPIDRKITNNFKLVTRVLELIHQNTQVKLDPFNDHDSRHSIEIQKLIDATSKQYLKYAILYDFEMLNLLKTQTVPTQINAVVQSFLKEGDLSYGGHLGPTLYTLDRYKFLFGPYTEPGLVSIDRGGLVNRTTKGGYANTKIKDFGSISVSDILYKPGRKTNICLDAEIKGIVSSVETPL